MMTVEEFKVKMPYGARNRCFNVSEWSAQNPNGTMIPADVNDLIRSALLPSGCGWRTARKEFSGQVCLRFSGS